MTANIQDKVDKLFSNELNDSKKLILSPKKKESNNINKNTENNHNEKKIIDNTNKNEQNNNNEINNNIKNNNPNFSSQKNINNPKNGNGGGMSLLGKIEVLMESMDKLFTSKEKISTNKNILNFLKNNKKEKEKFTKSLLYAKNPEKKKIDDSKSKISGELNLDLDDEDFILSRQDRRNRGKSYHVKSRFESVSCFKGILSKDSKKFKKPKFDLGKESEKKDIIEEKKEADEDKQNEDEFNKSKCTVKKEKLNKTLINKSYCTHKILQTKTSYFDLQKELKNEKLSKILNDSLLKEDNNPTPKSKKITRGLSSKMNDTKLTKKKKKFKKFNSIVEKNKLNSPSKRRKTENSSLKESKLSVDKKSNINKEKEKKKDNNEDSCFQSSDFLNESHSNDEQNEQNEQNTTHKKIIPKSHKSSKHIKCFDKNDGLILKKKKSKKENCSFYEIKSKDIKSKEIDKKDLSKNSTKFLKDNLESTKIKPFKLEEKNSLKNSTEIKIKRGNTKRKVQAPIKSSQYEISPNVNNLVILQGQENKKEKNENQNIGQKMNIINPKNFISIEYNINHGRKMDKDVEMNNNHIIINNNESNNIIYYKKDSEKKLDVIDTKSQQKINDSEVNKNNITNRNNNSSKDDKTHGKKEHKKSFCLCCL
jgi:hypothetical protein